MTSKRKQRLCRLPSPGSISGRSSSITNAFFNAIIPVHPPTEQEVLEALTLLGISKENITCAYCGEKSTEWDHLRPIITGQQPTGYITEIANLVPACGKCNQSKGKRPWREWMLSAAPLSPRTRGIANLDEKLERLDLFSLWKPATKIEFTNIVDMELWNKHHQNWRAVLDLMAESEQLARLISKQIEAAPRFRNSATGEITYGGSDPNHYEATGGEPEYFTTEEVFARIEEQLGLEAGSIASKNTSLGTD